MKLLEELKEKINNKPLDVQVQILLEEYKALQHFYCNAIFTHIENVVVRIQEQDGELWEKEVVYTFIVQSDTIEKKVSIEAKSFEKAKTKLIDLGIDPTQISVVEVRYKV